MAVAAAEAAAEFEAVVTAAAADAETAVAVGAAAAAGAGALATATEARASEGVAKRQTLRMRGWYGRVERTDMAAVVAFSVVGLVVAAATASVAAAAVVVAAADGAHTNTLSMRGPRRGAQRWRYTRVVRRSSDTMKAALAHERACS